LNYWAIRGFHTLLFDGGGVGAIAQPLTVFAVVGLVSGLLGASLTRRQLVRGA
jgi:hypothetical protein